MASGSFVQTSSLLRGVSSGHLITLKPRIERLTPCCAERRRFYRGSSGRFPEDFNQVAEVIADVLAGAETIYTASNRAREQAVARPETVEWPAQTETAASADAQSDDKADSAEFSRSRQYGEDDAVQMYPVDIEETGEGYSLFMDVPGLQKSDIKVQVIPSKRIITISGERIRKSLAATDEAGRPYKRRYERRLGKFSRTLRLAKDLDVKTLSARVDCGVLHVTAKKMIPEEPEAMQIDID